MNPKPALERGMVMHRGPRTLRPSPEWKFRKWYDEYQVWEKQATKKNNENFVLSLLLLLLVMRMCPNREEVGRKSADSKDENLISPGFWLSVRDCIGVEFSRSRTLRDEADVLLDNDSLAAICLNKRQQNGYSSSTAKQTGVLSTRQISHDTCT